MCAPAIPIRTPTTTTIISAGLGAGRAARMARALSPLAGRGWRAAKLRAG